MPRVLKIVMALALVMSLMGTVAASAPATQASKLAVPSTVIYNLYATDTFIKLADGTLQYMYGFVGGRQGVSLTFQNSQAAAVNPGLNTTISTGAPAPSAGAVTAAELPLQGNAQFPAPVIYAAVGDVVEIRLKNLGVTNKGSPNDPHSIHLHGLDVDAANDGVPETSVGAVPANLAVPGAGNVVVYMFSPTHPGTYMYHCHQEADIHVQMGMFGALVVYNPGDPAAVTGPGSGVGGNLWGWNYDRDYILLLSEFDTRQHLSEQMGWIGAKGFNPVNFQPQYWTINGLSFPNTIHVGGVAATYVNWGDWILAHPGYDPLIVGSVSTPHAGGTPGDKVLIRVINMGFEMHPMHMHGFHGKVIGSDQRPWPWANTAGQPAGVGLEKNTLAVGSGETYEWLIDFGTQKVTSTYADGSGNTVPGGPLNGEFAGGTQTRYYNPALALCVSSWAAANPGKAAPVLNTPVSNKLTDCTVMPVPGLVPAATYIGGPTVTGAIGVPQSSQLFPFHDHDDYKATNNGVYPGGMFTMIMPLP